MNEEHYLVGYYPYNGGRDQYMKTVVEETTAAGFPVIGLTKALKNPRIYWNIKVVNLNWFESVNVSGGGIRAYITFIKRVMMLFFFRLTGKKIVFTFHNAFPHGIKEVSLSNTIVSMLAKWSVKIVSLCDYSEELLREYIPAEMVKRKMVTIPIASYKDSYCDEHIDFRGKWGVDESTCIMTFCGSIQPYKNIELIISVAKRNPHILFVLAGRVRDEKYKKKLEDLSAGCTNIIKIFRFIEDNELPALIKNSTFILTPYDKSSLNSGVVILAFSYGRTVICPEIGTIKQLGNLEHVYSYNYDEDQDHEMKLNTAVEKAYFTFINSPEKIAKDNLWVETFINENNSRSAIREGYKNLYNEIIGEQDDAN